LLVRAGVAGCNRASFNPWECPAMTTPTIRSVSLAAAALALALPVAAQTTPTPAPAAAPSAAEAAFKRADANSDGKLSKEEAARLPAIAAKFTDLDKDKDGALSMSEFMAGYEAPKQ
jgi:hypothetical protein